jgi:hypothetical protein
VEEAYTQQGRAHIRRLHPDWAARSALMRRAAHAVESKAVVRIEVAVSPRPSSSCCPAPPEAPASPHLATGILPRALRSQEPTQGCARVRLSPRGASLCIIDISAKGCAPTRLWLGRGLFPKDLPQLRPVRDVTT